MHTTGPTGDTDLANTRVSDKEQLEQVVVFTGVHSVQLQGR